MDDTPSVLNFEITPSKIAFDAVLDGQKDTTITFSLQVDAFDLDKNAKPMYYFFINDEDEPRHTGEFALVENSPNTYKTTTNIVTNTYTYINYKVLVTPGDVETSRGNYIQSIITQTGVPLNAPVIMETNAPITVTIPTGDEVKQVFFTAKVIDADGQDNIENVYLNFRNADGTLLLPQPYIMLDDGKINVSGDKIAGDSVFTKALSINSSNSPNNRTALYWVIDKGGLSSDTLEVPFNIVK